ncbi:MULTISPECIES: hypothetical protein [unclassified Moorena]|uniref:hypothetical protein n=1 Tax=unclassified Moorena TaxID=2683338 RepID=UPI0013B7E4B3|nr:MULTISPECIES: hypothetical protein [unclassified Moorena]NER85561.1 hypothetical protein [Moorena sp. SIO3A2]NES42824.1 hypothetical protein [Moorena sp. SIO2C4]
MIHLKTEVPPKFELLETSIPISVVFLDYDVLTATGYSLIENAHNVQLKGYEAMQRGLGEPVRSWGFPRRRNLREWSL